MKVLFCDSLAGLDNEKKFPPLYNYSFVAH